MTADEVRSDVGEKEAEETAMKFMKEKGLLSGKYVLDRAVRNDDGTWVMDYIETYGGSLLFDNYFSVTVSGGRVIRLEYQRHQFRGLSGESTEQFEAYQALLAYFKEGSNIVITSIDSGYAGRAIDERGGISRASARLARQDRGHARACVYKPA